MKVVHVVTLVSSTGAYGGPLRVALNQAQELARRGHQVELVAGWQGEGSSPPTVVEDVPASLFPAHVLLPGLSFSGLYAPGLVRHLEQTLADADLVHIHAGRDLISLAALRAAHRSGTPYLVQTHGMVGVDHRLRAKVVDAVAMRRLMGSARHHLVLNPAEAADMRTVLAGEARLVQLPNGVPPPVERLGSTTPPEVLFCARLHPRKRPEHFVEMAALVRDAGVPASFRLVGPDEGSLPGVRRRIAELHLGDVVHYEGPLRYDQVLHRMSLATVYVLPSVNEPNAMSLLEAMSLGLPSVCTDSTGVADVLREHQGAVLTDGSPQQLADAVIKLLQDPDYYAKMSQTAKATVQDVFSIQSVVAQLEGIYEEMVKAPRA